MTSNYPIYSTYPIYWTDFSETTTFVKIELSTDNESTWSIIDSRVFNNSTYGYINQYNWTVDVLLNGVSFIKITSEQTGEYVVSQIEYIEVDFSGSLQTCLINTNIDFNETTIGVTGWYWDFGDGNTSTEQNPSHSYSYAGIYSVQLTGTSSTGEQVSENKPNYINVTDNDTSIKKIYLIATNQRVSAYRTGTSDLIQIKVQIYSNNRSKISYLKNIPISLRLNYNGWKTYDTGVTDKFGNFTFFHACDNITVANCQGYIIAIIDNKAYYSNVFRLNFSRVPTLDTPTNVLYTLTNLENNFFKLEPEWIIL